jgi:hypothetical protein
MFTDEIGDARYELRVAYGRLRGWTAPCQCRGDGSMSA